MTGPGTLGFVPIASTLSALRTRFGALVREIGKFGVVGGLAFVIDFVLFNLLLRTGAEPVLAKAGSTLLSTTVAFLGNRNWTWRDLEHTGMARQYATFFLLNGVGLGISLGCLGISHYGLGSVWPEFQSQLADNISGMFIGTALGSLFRFWSYRRFVFVSAPAPVHPVSTAPRNLAADRNQTNGHAPAPRAVQRM